MSEADDEAAISVADEEPVEVVILRADAGKRQVTSLFSDVPIDVEDPSGPPHDVVADLLDSAVRLVAPTDVPLEVVDRLRQVPVPAAFGASSWLREHRALILREGTCRLGPVIFRYDPQLGLSIDEAG